MTVVNKSLGTWSISLLASNIIGAIIFVLLASHAWVIPEECAAGINTTTGEPFVWFSAVVRVIPLFCLINLIWGVLILKRRQWTAGRFWLASAAIWLIAAYIDFSHHQC
jgi:hypothetical protein